jgi:hypothetical protein
MSKFEIKNSSYLSFGFDLTFDAVVQSQCTSIEVEIGTLASDEL